MITTTFSYGATPPSAGSCPVSSAVRSVPMIAKFPSSSSKMSGHVQFVALPRAETAETQQDLAVRLWRTGDTAARLLALLIWRPKACQRDELDAMVREARTPKVHDWLVNYVVKKSPHAEELRLAWSADPDPVVASAGWALTVERVAKKPDGLDLAGLVRRRG